MPPEKIKELSRVEPAKAIAATAGEWASIAAAIALCTYFWNPLLYVLAVMFIGARQHALIIDIRRLLSMHVDHRNWGVCREHR